MAQAYFPEQAIAVVRAARFNPKAQVALELFCGALVWNDEAYLEFPAVCRHYGCTAYWEPVLYRSSLIRGQPNESYRRGWEELQQACAGWPGFRPERRSEALRTMLERLRAAEA